MERKPTAEKIYDLLIRLLADQEGVKISYRLESEKDVRDLQNHTM